MLPSLGFILIQLCLLLLFVQIYRKIGWGFISSFYTILIALLGLPFLLLFFYSQNVFALPELLGRQPEAKLAIPLGNGFRPLTLLLSLQLAFLGGAAAGTLGKVREIVERPLSPLSRAKYLMLARGLALIAVSYTLVRLVLVPDFPLFVLIKSGNWEVALRDVAFEYGSNHKVPYIFQASINSQFYRIFLPLAGLMLISTVGKRTSKIRRAEALFVVFLAGVMSFGTLKRTPIMYLALWFITCRYMYSRGRFVVRLAGYGLAMFIVLCGITLLYHSDSSGASAGDAVGVTIRNLAWRILVGEAIEEFTALEHFGTSLEYLGFDIPLRYGRRVSGQNVMTFSEYWKTVFNLDGRGYSAIGVLTELQVSGSILVSIPMAALMGFSLCRIDRKFRRVLAMSKPFLSGLMVVVAAMSVKGMLSELFTGGGFTILGAYLVWLTIRDRTENVSIARVGPSFGKI